MRSAKFYHNATLISCAVAFISIATLFAGLFENTAKYISDPVAVAVGVSALFGTFASIYFYSAFEYAKNLEILKSCDICDLILKIANNNPFKRLDSEEESKELVLKNNDNSVSIELTKNWSTGIPVYTLKVNHKEVPLKRPTMIILFEELRCDSIDSHDTNYEEIDVARRKEAQLYLQEALNK